MTPALNKPLPEFEALATGGVKFTPQSFVGQTVVLYFYPKDHTPGCTTEAMQFRDKHKEFVKAGAVVFGVSRDNLVSHDKFKLNLIPEWWKEWYRTQGQNGGVPRVDGFSSSPEGNFKSPNTVRKTQARRPGTERRLVKTLSW